MPPKRNRRAGFHYFTCDIDCGAMKRLSPGFRRLPLTVEVRAQIMADPSSNQQPRAISTCYRRQDQEAITGAVHSMLPYATRKAQARS